ncbi:MAG TPA: O-antigen ligase family protein [Chloroflexota bacterium]|nr:O-antigen ligase family protein [Chloroflexota bacterium]
MQPEAISFPVSAAARGTVLLVACAVLALGMLLPPGAVLVGISIAAVVFLTLVRPVVGFIALAVAAPWLGGMEQTFGTFSLAPTDLLIAGIGIAWLADAAVRRHSLIATRIWTPYVFLYLVAISLSALAGLDWHSSLKEIVKWAEMLVIYLAAVRFLRRRDVPFVLAALIAAGVSQAILGYIQFLFGLGPEAFLQHRLFLRAYGTFDQPNPYAGYLNMIIPFSLVLGALPGRGRGLSWAAFILMVGALLASQSRGALLAFLVASTIVCSVLWSRAAAMARLGLLALAAGGWLASFGLVPLGPFQKLINAVGLNVTFSNVTNANFSAVERAAHWLAGVRMFSAHPLLGVGIGNFGLAYPRYHPRGWYASLEHAHNYYINVAAEAGVVGLGAYLLVAGSALWYSYRAIRLATDRFSFVAALGLLGVLVATDFHNVFDVLYVHGLVALLGLLVALVPVSLGVREAG